MTINPKKNYKRISNGDIISGEQVQFLLEMANPLMQAVILLDITETTEPITIDKNYKPIKEKNTK